MIWPHTSRKILKEGRFSRKLILPRSLFGFLKTIAPGLFNKYSSNSQL